MGTGDETTCNAYTASLITHCRKTRVIGGRVGRLLFDRLRSRPRKRTGQLLSRGVGCCPIRFPGRHRHPVVVVDAQYQRSQKTLKSSKRPPIVVRNSTLLHLSGTGQRASKLTLSETVIYHKVPPPENGAETRATQNSNPRLSIAASL